MTSLHDMFEPSYINMGRNGVDLIGYITDAECAHVCTAPDNETADLIVAALNRDDNNRRAPSEAVGLLREVVTAFDSTRGFTEVGAALQSSGTIDKIRRFLAAQEGT